jgi:hypothetical protein
MAFDPAVRFPAFNPIEGHGTIGSVHRIQLGEEEGLWQWAITVSLTGPRGASAIGGVEPSRSAAARRVIEVYRHYLSTRPESYARSSLGHSPTRSKIG